MRSCGNKDQGARRWSGAVASGIGTTRRRERGVVLQATGRVAG